MAKRNARGSPRGTGTGEYSPTHAIDEWHHYRNVTPHRQAYLRSARRSALVCAWKPARIGVTDRDDPQFWQCKK